MFRFSPKQPGEIQAYTSRFNREIGVGEWIVSASFTVAVLKGVESPVTLVTSGAPVITSPDAAGNHDVSQNFSGGLAGIAYAETCAAVTSLGRVIYDTCEIDVLNPS